MIFLLNREYIVWEAVELTRLHICEVLRVSSDKVEAQVDLAGGKLSPEFLVALDDCEGLTPDEIKEVMRHAYNECKEEMETRLKGVSQTRENVLQWLRGGMTDEEYSAVRDPAADTEPPVMADALAPVIPISKSVAFQRAKIGWHLRDAWRWVRLILTGIGRRLAFWR